MYHEQLAEAEIRLRDVKDTEARAKLAAEQRAITAAGSLKALGSNDDERKRALLVAVAEDPDCLAAQREVRKVEAELSRLGAQLEAWKDERRAKEWEIRSRTADALRSMAMLDGEPDDTATISQALDDATSRLAAQLLRAVTSRVANATVEEMPF